MQDSDQLLLLYQKYSTRVPWQLQAGGGNFSVKDRGNLFIKASGKRFDQIKTEKDLVLLPLGLSDKLKSIPRDDEMESNYSDMLKAFSNNGMSPSMESGFHLGLSPKWIFHFHSLWAVFLAEKFFTDPSAIENLAPSLKNYPWKCFDYIRPGVTLQYALDGHPEQIILLRNHGIILQSKSVKILEAWDQIENEIKQNLGIDAANIVADVASIKEAPFIPNFPDAAVFNERIEEFARVHKIKNPFNVATKSNDEKNYLEIWQASVLLQKLCPELQPIDSTEGSALRSLPSEKVRLG